MLIGGFVLRSVSFAGTEGVENIIPRLNKPYLPMPTVPTLPPPPIRLLKPVVPELVPIQPQPPITNDEQIRRRLRLSPLIKTQPIDCDENELRGGRCYRR